VVDSITEEIDEGTFELLPRRPRHARRIVDGKALAAVAIAPDRRSCGSSSSRVNGTPVANVPSILVLMTALTTLVVALAIAISALAPDDARRSSSTRSACWSFSVAPRRWPAGPRTRSLARLAIDSADVTTTALVVAYVGIAGVAYVGVRTLVAENGFEN